MLDYHFLSSLFLLSFESASRKTSLVQALPVPAIAQGVLPFRAGQALAGITGAGQGG